MSSDSVSSGVVSEFVGGSDVSDGWLVLMLVESRFNRSFI